MRKCRAWTTDETGKLNDLLALGLGCNEIGRRMGRSPSSIRNRVDDISGRRYALGRVCSDCPKPIRNDNASGRCKACATAFNNRLPETKEKRVIGWKRRMSDPRQYAKLCHTARMNSRKAMADPVKRAAAAERAKKIMAEYLDTPEMRAHINSPEVRARAGRKISEFRMSWCPPEYREMYYDIRRKVQCSAADARQIVFDQIKSDRAKLSPFERQMRALEKGAKLAANDPLPSGNQVVRRFG